MKRLVVKVGSRLLAEPGGGLLPGRTDALAGAVAERRREGAVVVLVSSGAIACGWPRLKLAARPTALPELQAAAAAGQSALMHSWEDSFARQGLVAAQLLLTRADFTNRRRYLNARDATRALLALGAVPVVNENDTVATEEIRYGDNDNLSAEVAGLIEADLLVLLTDIDGLHSADPRLHPEAGRVEVVEDLEAAAAMAGGAGSAVGTGGMITKIEAARKAVHAGIAVVIADGRDPQVLSRIARGESVGTRFPPRSRADRLAARKRWIAHTLKVEGRLSLDPGAEKALASGRSSLLPSGVTRVEGEFRRGAAVELVGPNGAVIARGLAAYDAAEARRIAGKRSGEIEGILGYSLGDELVHRDDLVLLLEER